MQTEYRDREVDQPRCQRHPRWDPGRAAVFGAPTELGQPARTARLHAAGRHRAAISGNTTTWGRSAGAGRQGCPAGGYVAQLLDVDVNQRPRCVVFVAADDFSGPNVDVGQTVQLAAHQDRMHRGSRHRQPRRDRQRR
jgi:hypothetical protein